MSETEITISTLLHQWVKNQPNEEYLNETEVLAVRSPDVVYQTKPKAFTYEGSALLEAIQKGMIYSTFLALQPLLPLSEIEWSDIFDLSLKTLQRYKKESTTAMLKPIQTEKVVHVAQVTELGIAVFGTKQTYEKWLNSTNFALGSVTPKSLLKSSYGKDLLVAELTRIDHGIFA